MSKIWKLFVFVCTSTLGLDVFAANLSESHVQKGMACNACHAETPPAEAVVTAKCQSCHGDYAKLAERTKDMKPNNVHANHLGDLECSECHTAHEASKLACDECHQFKFAMPGKQPVR